jgi:hypothetical protein
MKQLLIETHAFKASPQQLTENVTNDGNLLVEGVLATAEVKNGNGRYYSRDLWEREMGKYNEEVDESFDSVVDDIMDQGKSREDAEKIAGAINAKYVGNYKD